MSAKVFLLAVCLLFAGLPTFGQVGNGSITGTVSDLTGAVVAGASVEAKNAATGVAYGAASTNSGNYTIPDLPAGTYIITVAVRGFKTYIHSNLAVPATQTLREDVALEVGASTEFVAVTAEARLLKTETGELAHNITVESLDNLPLLGIGTANAGTSGYRNPYNVLQTIPGVSSYASSEQFTLNGLGGTLTETMLTEGQDSTSRLFGTFDYTEMSQPSADSVQEIAFQTSNYSPEFGSAGSVVINMTMKSGTNQYHGSGYDYLVNEDLNAGDPFSVSGGPGTKGGDGGKYRPRNRRNDFGGTLGGPVYIPKIYDGHNKTFWFFNYEQYGESTMYSFTDTVPTQAYYNGDFSMISPNGTCALCSRLGIPTGALGSPTVQLDALGRQMYANTIYDPASRGVNPANNLGYAAPFLNNMIPASRFDPVAVDFQNLLERLLPAAPNSNVINNYSASIAGGRYSAIPSVKIDHNIDAKDKLSFYYSENNTQSQISSPSGNADGLPEEIGEYRGNFATTYTERLNFDRALAPTLLLHLGAGYYHTSYSDKAPFTNFNPSQFGLSGFLIDRQFPSITGLNTPTASNPAISDYGGMQNFGTSGQVQSLNYEEKPTFAASMTWIHGRHTFKIGSDLYLEGVLNGLFSGVTLTTGSGPTAQPFTPTQSLNGFTQGFGYASFLLGDWTSNLMTPQENYREGNAQFDGYLQDSWKATHKLTIDYGVRYDFASAEHEQYNRLGQTSLTLPNANAGGHPGATIYANTCGCSFYQKAYPYGIGPRLGVAYQIDKKTVFRAGWGVVYQFVAAAAGSIVTANGSYNITASSPSYVPAPYQFVNDQTPGFLVQPTWPDKDLNRYPLMGSTGGNAIVPDGNENRPPRVNQWSAGFQREITRDFIMEASYVANRAVWITGPLGELSQISPAQYAAYDLYPYPGTGPCASGGGVCASSTYNNNADRALLNQSLSSTAVIQHFAAAGLPSLLPYTGYPTSSALVSALAPFPQFGAIEPNGSPTGNSKYDALQVKATKRFSRGLQAGGAYTWGQGFTRANRQDFFNPESAVWALQQIPPQTLTFNFVYTVPKASFLPKFVNLITKDWQLGGFANYQSGVFLTPPTSTVNQEFLSSEDLRVAAQPLVTPGVNLNNLSTYNPYTNQVLNPNAWAPCPLNTTCEATGNLIKAFRAPRQPHENANIGRNFRIKERMNFQFRGEFVNIFNRTLMPAPMTTNPQNGLTHGGAQGQLTAGFGVIDAYQAPSTATIFTGRTGTLIARFTF